jgi:hypothetical protein
MYPKNTWAIGFISDIALNAMAENETIAIVKHYLATLPSFGIHANRAVLFGSYVLRKANEYSDIDLVVIAPEFDGSREISLVKVLWRSTITDNRIEPISLRRAGVGDGWQPSHSRNRPSGRRCYYCVKKPFFDNFSP